MNFNTCSNRIKSVALVLLLTVMPGLVYGQMFSADNESRGTLQTPNYNIYAGIEPLRFEYRGPANVPGTPFEDSNANLFGFKGEVVRIGFDAPAFKVSAGFGAGLDNVSYFDLNIHLGYNLPVYRSRTFFFGIPVLLRGGYTSVVNQDVIVINAPQFQQGNFGGAIGVRADLLAAHNFRIGAKILPSYGFTFSTRDRNRNGGLGEIKGQLRLYFDHLFGNAGLSTGYDYTFRQYNIEGQLLDYRSIGNSFLIGITF